jgi:hypothetical protein
VSTAVTTAKSLLKTPFKNLHSTSVPAFGVMQVTGSLVESGVTFLTCTQPGGALGTEFAINGPVQVAPGQKGVCYRQGDLQVAYDSGGPQLGEGWGARAGQWTLSKGYPTIITVQSVTNAANNILYGTFTPLASVLGAAGADLPPIVGTAPSVQEIAVYVWGGQAFNPATPAMTFAGYNASSALIKAGTLTQFSASNGLWVASGGSLQLVRFELTADLVYGTDPGSDNAKVLSYHDGAYHADGATIRVFDWSNDATADGGSYGTWAGKAPAAGGRSGYQGWAIKSPDSNRYEIVWMERQARLISFRLYQQLQTNQASQTACAVLAFWDGRDPDPTSAGITVYNLAIDYANSYKFAADANAVGYAIWNEKLSRYQIIALEGDGRSWVLVKNQSGYTAPANSVVAVTGVARDNGGHTQRRNLLTVGQPDTTLRRGYLITGYASIPNNTVGLAFGFDGLMEAAYDSGSPTNGESWGPKPGQFTLSRGWPGFVVDGVNGDNTLAVVRFEPIVQLLGKTTAPVSPNSTTTAYQIWTGLQASESNAGYSVPTAFNRTSASIPSGKFIRLTWMNNSWYIEPLEC